MAKPSKKAVWTIPQQILLDSEAWPALNPKSAFLRPDFLSAKISLRDLLTFVHDNLEGRADAWEHLAPEEGYPGEAEAGDLHDHMCGVAVMRYILRADHALRAVLGYVEASRNKSITVSDDDAEQVLALVSAAIRPDYRPKGEECR